MCGTCLTQNETEAQAIGAAVLQKYSDYTDIIAACEVQGGNYSSPTHREAMSPMCGRYGFLESDGADLCAVDLFIRSDSSMLAF